MHYANGRAAKVGDIVRGKGYNIKHEVIGLLVNANPAATACNCTVACVTGRSQKRLHVPHDPEVLKEYVNKGYVMHSEIIADLEYGQLDAFVALDPATGEVLPPE